MYGCFYLSLTWAHNTNTTFLSVQSSFSTSLMIIFASFSFTDKEAGFVSRQEQMNQRAYGATISIFPHGSKEAS